MTDLTRSDSQRDAVDPKRINASVANTVQSFAGALGALAGNLAGTNQGFAIAGYDNLVGIIPLGGRWSDETLGDTTSTALPAPTNNASIRGQILKNQAVTGVVNDATDIGKVIFADSNGPPFVLAAPANSLPLGVVLKVNAAGLADLYMFGFESLCLLGLLSRSNFSGAFTSFGTDVGNP